MAWIRLDDQYPDHPKLKAVGAVGLAIQTAAICYCGRYLTDGLLSFSAADALVRSVLAPFTLDDRSTWTVALTSGMSGQDAEELDWKAVMVKAGLWEQRDGGFAIHDYLRYNPSRRDFTQLLKNKRIAGQAGGQASAQARAQARAQAKFNHDPSLSSREQEQEKKGGMGGNTGTPRKRAVLGDEDFLTQLKANPAYRNLDIDRELAKIDAWLLTPRGRGKRKTRGRIVAWLNRALEDLPVEERGGGAEAYGYER